MKHALNPHVQTPRCLKVSWLVTIREVSLLGKKTSNKFKIPFDRDFSSFAAHHAKRTDHISTRKITAIHVGPFFGVHKGKTDFALLNARCVHNC
jgi:hypothetical protein